MFMKLKKDCIFCKIVNNEINSKKVYEDDNFIAILDANPRVDGHTLIITKQHFRNLLDMPSSIGNELLDAIKNVSFNIIKHKKADGINVISNNESSAGQAVFHTHLHIIPRKKNDGLKI